MFAPRKPWNGQIENLQHIDSKCFFIIVYFGNAAAHLDPGTGSIILQGLLVVIAGAAVSLKMYRSKIRDLFARTTSEPDPTVQTMRLVRDDIFETHTEATFVNALEQVAKVVESRTVSATGRILFAYQR